MSIKHGGGLSYASLAATATQTTVGSGSAVALTTVTTANVTSKSLVAGTYLCFGVIDLALVGATVTLEQGGLSATTALLQAQTGGGGVGPDPTFTQVATTVTASQTDYLVVGPTIVTFASTTTLFLVAQATFSAGSVSAYGTLTAIQI